MSPAAAEQRHHKRFVMRCPITLFNEAGQAFFTQTVDLSDGGVLVAFPFGNAPPLGEVLALELHIPSSSSRVKCQAKVVRHQDLAGERKTGVAFQFLRPQKLGLA